MLLSGDDSIRRCFGKLEMTGKTETLEISPTEALVKQAEALQAAASADRAAAEIYAEIARRGSAALPAALKANLKATTSDPKVGIANLPLTDAIFEWLKTQKKGGKKPCIIWKALSAAGCEVASDDPVSSVSWALKKRAKTNDDVVSVGWGLWDVKSNYTESGLKKILAKRSGRGGRSAAEHIVRTKNGIEEARAEGKQIGAKLKGNPEMYELIRKIILDGGTIGEACKQAGISVATFNTYRKKRLLGDLPTKPGRRKAKPRNDRDLLSGVEAGADHSILPTALRLVK
jgi:hypothetical protein